VHVRPSLDQRLNNPPRTASAPTASEPRWLGSLANVDGPTELARLGAAGDAETTAVLSAAPPRLVSSQYPARTGRQDGRGWPPPAAAGTPTAFADGQVLASAHGGPWFRPDLHHPDGGAESATSPDAALPVFGDTTPKTRDFHLHRLPGLPIPIRVTLPPVPPAYLEVALAVAGAAEYVLGRRRPLADLAAPAIREVMHGLLQPARLVACMCCLPMCRSPTGMW
jgi:hypothetical protein